MKSYRPAFEVRPGTLVGAFVLGGVLALHLPAQTTAPTPAVASGSATVVLDPFTVTAEQDHGYKAVNAVSATRMNAPIANIAQNINVLNSEFIEDTMSFNLTELLNYDAAFTPTMPDKGTYFARGFGVKATFVDGLAQRNTFGPNYTANVDRVEILKGPAAILYGDGEVGATINRVLKTARLQPATSVTLTAGDQAFRRAHLDTTGPLALKFAGRPLAYRFNFAWQNGHTFKLQSKDRALHYSPAFTIPLGPRTNLYLNYTYDKTNLTGNFATTVLNGVPGRVVLPNGTVLQIPIRNSMGEPFDRRPMAKTLTSYDFRHQFNRHLSFRSQYQYETYDQEISEIIPTISTFVYTATTASLRRAYRSRNVDLLADRARNEFAADFATGPLQHKTLVGFSFDETNESTLIYQTANTAAVVPPIDVINPVYGRYAVPALATVPITTNTQVKGIARAWYGNELVALFEQQLFLQGGYRVQDTYQRANDRRTRVVSAVPTDADTYSLGAVWHLNRAKSISLWAAASESFEPNFRVNPDGATLPPTTGRTREGGLKFDLLRGVLNGTVSTFRTVRANIPVAATDLGEDYYRPGPGQTGQGFEVSATYNPSRRFQINGGYAYTDAYTTSTRQTVANVSKDSISTFVRYEQPQGLLKGAFATAGYIYRSTRDPLPTATTTQPVWHVPEYKRLDLSIGYGWKWGRVRYRATANVQNAFDTLLHGDNDQNDRYVVLTPRNYRVSLRLQF